MIKIAAVLLVFMGLLGLFLPIIPGIIFIFLGGALLINIRFFKKIKQVVYAIWCRLTDNR
jgi:uncharacterized protein YqgC (DUF456 family)